jgi:hypothetical protein
MSLFIMPLILKCTDIKRPYENVYRLLISCNSYDIKSTSLDIANEAGNTG